MKIKNSIEKWIEKTQGFFFSLISNDSNQATNLNLLKKSSYCLFVFLIIGIFLIIVCLSNYEWRQDKINETWKEGNEMIKQDPESIELFTLNTQVQEVIDDPAFAGFGNLLFPIDLNIDTNLSLDDISHSST